MGHWLKLGVVGRAHGLRGSFFISGRDEPFPPTLKSIVIGRSPEAGKTAIIEQVNWQNGRVALKCDIASDRTAAEAWTGQDVWCEASAIAVDEASEYLVSDLKGRTVIDSAGTAVGTIDDIAIMPASLNLIVANPDKSADVEIPMITTYVDMGFSRSSKELRLTVLADTFADVWNPRNSKPVTKKPAK